MAKAKTTKAKAPKHKALKTPETFTKDGLFISRGMRRVAEASAKAEAERLQRESEDAQDAADAQAYAAAYPDQTDAERTFNQERAQTQADADARKKFGLD